MPEFYMIIERKIFSWISGGCPFRLLRLCFDHFKMIGWLIDWLINWLIIDLSIMIVSSDCVVDAEDVPTYSLLYVANFTTLNPGPAGKTPDFSCSNNYGKMFEWRVRQLQQRITSRTLRKLDVPKCSDDDIAGGSIDIALSFPNPYFSEYSHVSWFIKSTRISR